MSMRIPEAVKPRHRQNPCDASADLESPYFRDGRATPLFPVPHEVSPARDDAEGERPWPSTLSMPAETVRTTRRSRRLWTRLQLQAKRSGSSGADPDRKSGVSGKRVSVRVDRGGRGFIKKKKRIQNK